METGTDAAVAFLKSVHPTRPWALTAIAPDRKGIETRTFAPGQWEAARRWIEKYNGKRNIYWHVNEPIGLISSKAEKADIKAAHFLHVDVDPRAGESLEAEQERLRRLMVDGELWPADVPRPHIVLFSGGGYQCFYRLAEPVAINGDIAAAEEFERYNKALELALGGDNCHDVSRIMRLPGTLNIPDAKKLKKGRVPVVATEEFSRDGTVALDEMPKAPGTPSAEHKATATSIADLDALDEWRVSGKLKTIITDGALPVDEQTEKQKTFSRSEWLYRAVCDLIRHGVPDEIILGLISEKQWGISEHILAQPAKRREKYARQQIEKARDDVASKPPLLFAEAPMGSAREFCRRRHPTLMHNNDDWLAHNGAAYVELEDKTVRAELYKFLEQAQTPNKEGTPTAFNPTKPKVGNVYEALQGVTHRPRDIFAPPCWLDGSGPPPNEIIVFQNGLLHLPTGVLQESTSRFFTRNALTFDYDPAAPRPERWLAFLRSLWKDQPDSIDTLQEIFGYVLIPDTSQQKIFMLVGPKRSGKGSIARMLTELVGQHNVCGPTLNSLGDSFGLEPLIGKQLAVVADLRLGKKSDHAAIAENLLRISGEDMVDANRKYKRAWHGKLSARILVMTNLMPKFADASGALANRFVPLILHTSFLGRENPRLLDEMRPELPGILNWAIDGWRRLRERGYFELPESSRDAIQSLTDLASPEAAFVRDECELHMAAVQSKATLFKAWRDWCERNGLHPGSLDVFSSRLMAAANGQVTVGKPRVDGERVPSYKGIRIRPPKGKDDVPF